MATNDIFEELMREIALHAKCDSCGENATHTVETAGEGKAILCMDCLSLYFYIRMITKLKNFSEATPSFILGFAHGVVYHGGVHECKGHHDVRVIDTGAWNLNCTYCGLVEHAPPPHVHKDKAKVKGVVNLLRSRV